MKVEIPELALVLLIGASGSGKSTFARKHFLDSEVLSSDFCRGLVSNNENDQSATNDAFDVLHYIARKRLSRGLLTVVDATNVQAEARKPLIRLAREMHCLPIGIVLNLPAKTCHARNEGREDRSFGPHVVRQQTSQLRKSLKSFKREGLRHVTVLKSEDDIEAATIVRRPLWNNLRHEHGPFDVIGDVHGCHDELRALLEKLGYRARDGGVLEHEAGRKAVFLGDLVDRGPASPAVLRLVMAMVKHGSALCVPGNHDIKLMRKLRGRDVRVTHGLAETLEQLEHEPDEFKEQIREFIDSLVSHYVLDDGGLVVAHAGLKGELQGRASGKVREFALYGETTGETDEFGLPIRYDWAQEYRGRSLVVYGHTPVSEAEWVNGTICIDTGCVFGGKLTALRYPEKELVHVDAAKMYYEPAKPFLPAAEHDVVAGEKATSRRSRHRGRDGQAHRLHANRSHCDHPRGERGGSARGHESVCRRSAMAHLSAPNDVPFRDQLRGWAPRAPGRGVRVLPQQRRAQGGVRREAHGFTRCSGGVPVRNCCGEAFRDRGRPDGGHLHAHRSAFLRRPRVGATTRGGAPGGHRPSWVVG